MNDEVSLEFNFGIFQISAPTILETLAFVIGFRYFISLRHKQLDPVSEPNRIWIIIGAVFGAFFFSRVVGSV